MKRQKYLLSEERLLSKKTRNKDSNKQKIGRTQQFLKQL